MNSVALISQTILFVNRYKILYFLQYFQNLGSRLLTNRIDVCYYGYSLPKVKDDASSNRRLCLFDHAVCDFTHIYNVLSCVLPDCANNGLHQQSGFLKCTNLIEPNQATNMTNQTSRIQNCKYVDEITGDVIRVNHCVADVFDNWVKHLKFTYPEDISKAEICLIASTLTHATFLQQIDLHGVKTPSEV